MNSLLSIAYFFIFTWFTFAEVSPIAGHVDRINEIIPEKQRRENTVEFLKDPKVWESLKNVPANDFEGLKEVIQAVKAIIGELIPGDMADPNLDKCHKVEEVCKQLDAYFLAGLNDKELFSIEKGIGLWADLLVAHNDVRKLPQSENPGKKPLGDLVERMSLAMKKLNPKKWDDEFYGRLLKAADNQKYDNQKSNNQKTCDQNDNGNWKEYLPHIFLVVGIVGIAVGVFVFVILRRKRQIKS
jgi:hypothetical protein